MSPLDLHAIFVARFKRVGVDVAPALAAVPPPFEADGVGLVGPFAEAETEEGYERSPARQDTRAGSYERTLQTKAGDVNLKVPKLRRQTFETA
ncbi:transposase, partial [Bradyrhizobium yuanmingense]|uniref:transposase n=1 Tax=Bradyrhizobium yuanmingense TaxID=108015 RepID=UPI001CD36ED9